MAAEEGCALVAFAVEFGTGGDGFEGDEFRQGVYELVCVISISFCLHGGRRGTIADWGHFVLVHGGLC